jgi:pimeloyl-ACP methyl ester carboxylesterase
VLTEKAFDAGPLSINYVEGPPSGAPLVLLHGLTGRWQTFDSIIPLLGWRRHLYGPDLRGHGRSGHADGDYRIVDYAADTARLLREVVREPAVLVGWSLGALVAVEVAAQAQDAVRAIVLIDPGFGIAPLRTHAKYSDFVTLRELAGSGRPLPDVASALARLWGVDAANTRGSAAGLLLVDPDTIARFLDDTVLDGFDLDERLARIACPVLLVQADPAAGGYLTDERADRAAAALADCALVRLTGVGHGVQGQQPVPFTQMVNQFLDSLT